MRLKYLVAVGVALVFIMVVANGVVGTSDGSNRLAVILVIDDSASVNKLEDPDDKRIDKARSFVRILNESTDVVGLVSTQRSYKSADTYICKGPTQDFGIIYEELDKIKNHSSDDYYGFTNIDEFLIKSIYLLEEMEFKEFEYKVILLFSDGEPMDGKSMYDKYPYSGYTPPDNENSPLRELDDNKSIWIYTVCVGGGSIYVEILTEISNFTHSEFYWIDDFNDTAILSRILDRRDHSVLIDEIAIPSSGSNGTLINFTINVTNTGNATLNPVMVTDTLPEGLDYVSSSLEVQLSGDNLTWNLWSNRRQE